jgi:integrase
VTEKNVAEWIEHLRHAKGLSPKTVGDKYLCAIQAIYRLAISKTVLKEDPTARVKVSIPRPQKTRPKGFTDEEAVQILTCAMAAPATFGRMAEHNLLACQWVPWIAAYTGARGSEITQLRREDLMQEHGIDCFRITPDAGSVKTNAYRMVPLHPHLIDLGLVSFILSRPEGPLFHPVNAAARSNGTLPAARVLGKVSEWVRSVAGITDTKVKPTHGWRHRFKTVGRDVDISLEYLDAIQGHSDRRASSDYGEMSMKALYREIQKMPRYDVSQS